MDLISVIYFILRCLLWSSPVILVLYHRKRRRASFQNDVNKIPGPKTFPFLGNALDLMISPEEVFSRFQRDLLQWGPVIRFWILDVPSVLLMRARDLEVIMKDMTHHIKGESYKFLEPWMGQGLLLSKGDMWRLHRKVLTPAFHFNILHEFLPIFNKHALQLTKCLAIEADNKQAFNIFHYSSLCSLDIICESSMGTAVNAQLNSGSKYVHSVNKMNELFVRRYLSWWLRPQFLFNLSPTKREMDKTLDYLNTFTDKVIEDRRRYMKSLKSRTQLIDKNENQKQVFGERHSLAFLDLLLAAEEEGSEHMTQKDIRDQVSTFMFEGHDTVSTATCWVLFMLGTYPEHQARVVEELVSVFGDSGRAPDMSDLANLKYLERCIKETLRLYPSVPFMERQLYQDAKIENHVLPAGVNAIINVFMLHRDPEFWPDPEKFDPDRFLPEKIQGRNPYAYVPFSAGPRNCIGQKFAQMEEKVVVSTVLRRFRVEAAHTRDEAILQGSIVLRPKNGLKLRLHHRDSHPGLSVKA